MYSIISILKQQEPEKEEQDPHQGKSPIFYSTSLPQEPIRSQHVRVATKIFEDLEDYSVEFIIGWEP